MARDRKAYMKAYYQAHKKEYKAYYEDHKEEHNTKSKEWYEAHRKERCEHIKLYQKVDVNSLGDTKNNIRRKSRIYLNKHGYTISGYEIHHCCTYNEPYKFIYCSKELHLKIHAYLREHNINADSNHFEQIKHLLDDTVILYGLD